MDSSNECKASMIKLVGQVLRRKASLGRERQLRNIIIVIFLVGGRAPNHTATTSNELITIGKILLLLLLLLSF